MRTLHKIYIYRDRENLPEEGWFQACFACYIITSRLKLFDTIHKGKDIYEIFVYLCSDCKKKILKDEDFNKKFEKKCKKYIQRHLFKDP